MLIVMEIWIARHAEPDYEHDSITEKGEREAKLLAQRLSKQSFAAVYCSPMGRAQKTVSYTLEKIKMKPTVVAIIPAIEVSQNFAK